MVVAAVTSGFRAVLADRGDDLDGAQVRSLIPVSVRGDAKRGAAANQVSAMLVDLPVDVADPIQRFRAVQDKMGESKGSHMADAAEVVTHVGDLVPPMLMAEATRLALRSMRRAPQRSINTVTTNVPGPQFPLYCMGREMLEYLPFVPLSQGVRTGVAILSYNGKISFGVTGDWDAVPDVAVLADGIETGMQELLRRARRKVH